MRIYTIDNIKYKLSEIIINSSIYDGSDRFIKLPIGTQWSLAKLNQTELASFMKHPNLNTELLMVAIRRETDDRRRKGRKIRRRTILQNLEKNGYKNKTCSYKEYFTNIGKYKFVVSPEGNGIDTHRHYETWLSGGIPIIEEVNKSKIGEKYKNLPILYTKDYSEITEDYLNKKYIEMKDKYYDYSSLFMTSYCNEDLELIRLRTFYWVTRLISN